MKKDQIIARFRALFPDVKLSNKRLNALAVKLEAKDLQDEAAIDAQLHAANEILPFEEIAASDDTIANLNHKLKTVGKTAPKEGDDPQPQPEPKPDDMPKWAKDLLGEIQTLKAEKQQQTIAQKLTAHEKLKGIDPKLYAKWQMPTKEDEIDAFADEVAETYAGFAQQQTNAAFSSASKPAASAGSGTGKADPAIAAYAAKKAQSAQSSNK